MQMVGRKTEIRKLEELYQSGSAELLALYGRRRVGKTFLIDEVFERKITFRHAGLSPVDDRYSAGKRRKSRMRDQLKHFYRSLLSAGIRRSRQPETWLDAFYMLEDHLEALDDGKTRLLVFIDEIQWMDTPRAGFLTGFEAFWNGWACHRKNVMVIVCGSSTSWILDRVIHNHGGLYGRLTCQMNLRPFSLSECEEFFCTNGVEMSRYDIVQSYMMVGGIPYYLKYFERTKSPAQNIDAMFFSEHAPLRDEFDDLFASLFGNPDTMKSIIIALYKKGIGMTRKELIKETGIADSGEFSQFLKALVSGTFIMRHCPYGTGKRGERYMLTDPFCRFYLRFVKTTEGKQVNWVNIADTQAVTVWKGFAFENVCRNHIWQIKHALGISGLSTEESLWSRKGDETRDGAQIDMIISRRDHILHLCEMKFYSDEVVLDKEDHLKLMKRRNILLETIPKKTSIHNTLITTYGLKHNAYAGDYVHTVTMDALFAAPPE